MKNILYPALAAVMLTGCAGGAEYYAAVERVNTQRVEMVRAQSEAEAARIHALTQLAATGDEQARIAAVMGLAMMERSGGESPDVVEPRPQQSPALEWARVLVPFAGVALQGYYSYGLGKVQSDNSASVAISGHEAFTELGIGSYRTEPSPRYSPQDAYPLGEGRDVLVQPEDAFDLGAGR